MQVDSEIFKPNVTPREMIKLGIFGGSYFGIAIDDTEDDYAHMFNTLFKDIDPSKYLGNKYSAKLNRFRIRSGKDYRFWKDNKWISHHDPRGWFAWYCNYYMGRRCSDDERQIQRWNDFCGLKGRWRSNIYAKIHATQDWDVSPRIQQSLLHWGYVVNDDDYKLWLNNPHYQVINKPFVVYNK